MEQPAVELRPTRFLGDISDQMCTIHLFGEKFLGLKVTISDDSRWKLSQQSYLQTIMKENAKKGIFLFSKNILLTR